LAGFGFLGRRITMGNVMALQSQNLAVVDGGAAPVALGDVGSDATDNGTPLDRREWIRKIVRDAFDSRMGDKAWEAGAAGQSRATLFAWGCVLDAARAIQAASDEPMEFCAALGRDPEPKRELLRQCLGDARASEPSVLVDFALFGECPEVRNDSSTPKRTRFPRGQVHLTAESEMHVEHAAGWLGDFAWDFYKLLVVPSPLRLFFCRVLPADKPRKRKDYEYGMDRLKRTIQEMVERYRGRYLRDEDEVVVVMLSDAAPDAAGVNASCTAVFSQATGWTAQWDLIWDGGERDPD
jgi:hypothetical protein